MPPFDATFDSPVLTHSQARAARPLWFGNSKEQLFGWFHPAGTCARDAVVVMCQPFGYDAGTAHYAYQKLAERFALAGVATLRFDYAGTGDSAGNDDDPDRDHVAAWLASIGAAVAEARRLSGASQVILFGARFGALLATVYAQKNPVDGLVLLGPPRSGSAFVRELLAFNKMRSANPGQDASPDIEFPDDENLGFSLPSELRTTISNLDPRTEDEQPAPRVMVIARDDVPGPEVRLVEHLRELGVAVAHSHARGYSDMFDFRAVPAETVAEIVTWIDARPRGPRATQPGAGAVSAVASFDGVSEEAIRFDGLFGIVTHPAAGTPRETGILLLGTGANSHVGVNRMHVTLARALARLGFSVLRFDLSGVGESPVIRGRTERQFYTAQAVPETRSAIDVMMARGAKQVALVGLCSGGYTAFHTAVTDPRVSAIIPINVPGFHFNDTDSLALAANRPNARWSLPSLPSKRISKWLGIPRGPAKCSLRDDADDVARGFGKLLARGCRTRMVYGTANPGLRVLEGHLGPGLAKAEGEPNLALSLVNACDHTFTPRAAQRRLYALVTELFHGWLA